ncbi:TetR/AcrR family transcriptional regulator [Streptomyces sp. NPDC001970]
MPKRPYHHGDLRAALLERAEQTLREQGVDALSLRELARGLGVSHAAPSRHFKDKQALLDALALSGFERLAQVLEGAGATGGSFEERLTAHGRAYVDFMSKNTALFDLMHARTGQVQMPEQLAAAVKLVNAELREFVAEGQAAGEVGAGEPGRIVWVLASALHGFATFLNRGVVDQNTADHGLDDLVHYLLHGLVPREPSGP